MVTLALILARLRAQLSYSATYYATLSPRIENPLGPR